MDIYKHKIWTGWIPGVDSISCQENQLLINPSSSSQINQQTYHDIDACVPCTTLAVNARMDSCLDCSYGNLNMCCPDNETNCCGIFTDPCEAFYAQPPERITQWCEDCKNAYPFCSDWALYPCCNRSGKTDRPAGQHIYQRNKSVSVFLDQDMNDIGHYTLWDGEILQKDTFSNFVITGDPFSTQTISVANTTEFDFLPFTQGLDYSVNWGDPSLPNTILSSSQPIATVTYPFGGAYTITIQMSAPWGVSSVSQTVSLPFTVGANLIVANTGGTFTWNPPGYSTPPVTMDWLESEYGPLDSGLGINQYISANYSTTPFVVNGVTQSQLSSFQTYSQAPSNNPGFLPPGYNEGPSYLVPLGGQIELPTGTMDNNLVGYIIDANVNYTAYTISDGTGLNGYITMFDHANGTTLFESQSVGLNAFNLLTRECGMATQGTCDSCVGTQSYYDGSSYFTQTVSLDRGEWDDLTDYDPEDFVYHNGCCYFVTITTLAGNYAPDDGAWASSNPWFLCQGSCYIAQNVPSRYNCTLDGFCQEIYPSSTYYNTATFIGSPPSTANALSDCVGSCVNTSGQDMHYNCDNGICTPVTPGSTGYGSADHQGPTAYADCIGAPCVSTNTNHTCDNGTCVPDQFGFYADLTTCQSNCSVLPIYDYYCMNPGTSQPCTVVPNGDPAPGGYISGPYTSAQDCSNNCGVPETWRCKCTQTYPATEVDLGGGDYGGQECVVVNSVSDPGPFSTKQSCEDNCLSFECDETTYTCTSYAVSNTSGVGTYCSSPSTTGLSLGSGTYGNTVNIDGCEDNCIVPSKIVCIASTCVEVFELASGGPTEANPTHPGTVYDYNALVTQPCGSCSALGYGSTAACQGAPPSGGGCSSCDSNIWPEYPLTHFQSGQSYGEGDSVISMPVAAAASSQDYKYWFNTDNVCTDATIGGGSIVCSNMALWGTDCLTNSSNPCFLFSCNFGTYNQPPPAFPIQNREDSGTCWEPCGT